MDVIDAKHYVAGAVCAFDLRTLELKWHITLDVTTANTQYMVSSALTGDNNKIVICFRCRDGFWRRRL